MDPKVVDRIYECSFVPEMWRGVLGELAEIAGARAGFLFVSNGAIHDWASSTPIGTEAIKHLVESGWVARSERLRRLLATQRHGFISDDDIYSTEEMKSDPFYRDLLYPRGLGWAVGTAVPLPTGDQFSVNLEREYRLGPVGTTAIQLLDELRPHLARSALLFARLQLERARAATETLAAIGLPALVMNAQGRVLSANHLIQQMQGHIVWLAQGGVALKDRRAAKLLRAAVESSAQESGAGIRSFPARHSEAEEAVVAHVIPVRLSARDIFSSGAAALVLTPVTRPEAPPIELVRSLFDLTPAEARVARGLASGATVEGIASAAGVSPNTIRTHVRGVLTKTGYGRQSDAVALLNGIWTPRKSG